MMAFEIISNMAKQLNWHLMERHLRSMGLRLFTPQDLRNVTGGSEVALRFLITRAVKRGDLVKLRRELYALADNLPSDLEIANALYRPSYISFLFALAYYHLIPEAVYPVTCATTRTTTEFVVLGKSFRYHRLKRHAFGGYRQTRIEGRLIWIAEPEKALVDTLYFVLRKKWGLPERLDTRKLSLKRALDYAALFEFERLTREVRKYFD